MIVKPQQTSITANVELQKSGIAYFDTCDGSPVLLCIHGIQGTKESYLPYVESPLLKQVRLIAPDLPGFGGSQAPEDRVFTLERQADRLVTFLDALRIEKVTVYGHSLGGMLGTLLLERIPSRISGLICSEGNLRLQDCGESRRVASMDFAQFNESRFPELRQRGIKTEAQCFYETARSVVDISQSERCLSLITTAQCPVLFIRGGASHFATSPEGDNVRNLVLPGETHFTLLESQASIMAISDFVRSHSNEGG
jgi:pimeloyl-ACP methyl ester carboxylesterase